MDECGIGTDCSSIGHEKISWKLLCYSVLSGIAKRERRKSYFDISKYAQITKVSLSRNMMRYGHMDENRIGTDCVFGAPCAAKGNLRLRSNGTVEITN